MGLFGPKGMKLVSYQMKKLIFSYKTFSTSVDVNRVVSLFSVSVGYG